MELMVNGKKEVLLKEMSILAFLEWKGLNPKSVVIEYNENIAKSEEWESIQLKENDQLEVLRLVGGG
ncbi:MAG: thiamine biosynthesis protein ThiS [Firmicutes bacterium HGW-Firmicutes-1]|jgi:sulfur carrier protein|nr:MAG: thiamine biosynthesis protein ThiS [Firmicutes bacterium HGW-Firmicutes-1]